MYWSWTSAEWLAYLLLIVTSNSDFLTNIVGRRRTSPNPKKYLTEWATQISALRRQLQQFYFINLLTGQRHLPFRQSQWGRCGVIARVKSGLHLRGCMVNTCAHFHTWRLPQRKTQTSKPDIFPLLKEKEPGSNICRSKQLVVSQEKAGPLFNRCRLNVHQMQIFFIRLRQRTVVFPSACAIINNVCVIPDIRNRKDQRKKFIRGVSRGCDIQFVWTGILYPHHSSCLVHQQVSGSHLALRPNNTTEL